LTFGTLPSAQGWTYAASGTHAGTPEASVFSVGGGALSMNTIGLSMTSGGSIFYNLSGGITSNENKELLVRARCTGVEPSGTAPLGQGGFCFGFTTSAQRQYAFGLSDTKVMVLIPTGWFVFATNYPDNNQFHDYRFVWSTPNNGTFSLYRDAVLVGSSNTGIPVVDNRIFFGDGTGGANGAGQISSLRFLQAGAVPTRTSSWGRLKQLYH
jgi:hypothetical protein